MRARPSLSSDSLDGEGGAVLVSANRYQVYFGPALASALRSFGFAPASS